MDELRLANLVIAGASKAGTTSLYWYLAQHPDVCRSDTKETRYFSTLRHGGTLAPVEEYARHFSACGDTRYRMEATPGYFAGGKAVAEGIAQTLDSPRIVVSLRDPVTRFWSYYRFMKDRMSLGKDLTWQTYLERCEELRRDGGDTGAYRGLSSSYYGDFLGDWFDVFGRRLKIVFFEDLARQPAALVGELCEWLEIDPAPAASFRYTVENRTVPVRNAIVHQAVVKLDRTAKVFFSRHRGAKRTLRRLYYAVNARRSNDANPPAEAREHLAGLFAASNAEVARVLRANGYADLPRWLEESAASRSRA